jgi:hypothetical protein
MEWVVYHIMCGYVACVPDWNHGNLAQVGISAGAVIYIKSTNSIVCTQFHNM